MKTVFMGSLKMQAKADENLEINKMKHFLELLTAGCLIC